MSSATPDARQIPSSERVAGSGKSRASSGHQTRAAAATIGATKRMLRTVRSRAWAANAASSSVAAPVATELRGSTTQECTGAPEKSTYARGAPDEVGGALGDHDHRRVGV